MFLRNPLVSPRLSVLRRLADTPFSNSAFMSSAYGVSPCHIVLIDFFSHYESPFVEGSPTNRHV